MTSPKVSVDFAIITALPEELRAVLSKFSNKQFISTQSDVFPFHHVSVGKECGLITRSGPGNIPAARAATTVIERFKPTYLFMIGIAAGFANNKVNLGDVVVATHCYYDGSGKETPEGKSPEPKQIPTSNLLLRHSQDRNASNWKTFIQKLPPVDNFEPIVHHGVIVSSETVIGVAERMANFLKLNRQCRALAMEGYGVAEAAYSHKIDFLEIRGICDSGDTQKDDNWHEYAAHVAAAYTVDLIHYMVKLPSESNNTRNNVGTERSEPKSTEQKQNRAQKLLDKLAFDQVPSNNKSTEQSLARKILDELDTNQVSSNNSNKLNRSQRLLAKIGGDKERLAEQTLFPEAQTLLDECAKSSDGMIYILPMIGRTLVIQTNEITFPPEEDSQPRTVARWKAALKQLEDNKLITKEEDHFKLTDTGYEAVAPYLSREARTILKKASVGVGEGQIICSQIINNPFWLQINGTDPTGGDNSPRTRTRWGEALKQLEDKGLIEALSEKRDIFIITHDGYEVADTIGS